MRARDGGGRSPRGKGPAKAVYVKTRGGKVVNKNPRPVAQTWKGALQRQHRAEAVRQRTYDRYELRRRGREQARALLKREIGVRGRRIERPSRPYRLYTAISPLGKRRAVQTDVEQAREINRTIQAAKRTVYRKGSGLLEERKDARRTLEALGEYRPPKNLARAEGRKKVKIRRYRRYRIKRAAIGEIGRVALNVNQRLLNAPALKTLEQLNRLNSGISTSVRETVKHPTNPLAGKKGFAEGFVKNDSTWGRNLKELGAPKGVAAVGGFIADVALDPTTYVSGGSSVAAKAAVKAAGEAAAKGVAKSAAKDAARTAARRAVGDAAKSASRARASASALRAAPESSAIKTQRARIAALEAKPSRTAAEERKLANMKRNVERSGKRTASRIGRAEVPQPRVKTKSKYAKRALRADARQRGERAREQGLVTGKKKKAATGPDTYRIGSKTYARQELPDRGHIVDFGIGKARVRVTVKKPSLMGGEPKTHERARAIARGVRPRLRADVKTPILAHEAGLASGRMSRAADAAAAHQAQTTLETLHGVFPRMSDEDARIWVKARESASLDGVPEHLIENGKLIGEKRVEDALKGGRNVVLKSGQNVGDVTRIRVPQPAKTNAALKEARGAERAAEKQVREITRRLGRSRVRMASASAVAKRAITSRDRALIKEVLPESHPLRVAMRDLSRAAKALSASGKGYRNRVRGANGKLYTPSERVGGLPRRISAKEEYAAAKATYERELNKMLAEADRLHGLGYRSGLAKLSRQGQEGVLRQTSKHASDVEGYKAELAAAKKAKTDATRARVEASARHAKEVAKARKVKPVQNTKDVARKFYPHSLSPEDAALEAKYEDLDSRSLLGRIEGTSYKQRVAKSETSHIKRRSNPERIDVQNVAREQRGEAPFSTNPVLDVSNYELGMRRLAGKNNAITEFASRAGEDVKFAAIKPGGTGYSRRFNSFEDFARTYNIDRDRQVYFIGTRNGEYGLHHVMGVEDAEKALNAAIKTGRSSGRYVVLDRRALRTALERSVRAVTDVEGLRWYDRFTGGMKRLAISTPMYHAINHMGDTWIMYTVVPGRKIPEYQAKSVKILRFLQAKEAGKEEIARRIGAMKVNVAGRDMTVEQFAKELMSEGAARQGFYARLEDIQHFAEMGVKLSRGLRGSRGWKAWKRTLRSREDMNRIGTYWYLRDEGKNTQQAADEMLNALIDYGELSGVEKNAFRRLSLFYMFPARQIPYQTKALFKRPGKFAAYQKLRLEAAQYFDVPPDALDKEAYWKQAALGIPVRIKGEVRYLSFNPPITMLNQTMPLGVNATITELPTTPFGEWLANPFLNNEMSFLGGQLNPLLKIPLELGTNYNLFYRSPIEPEFASTTPAPLWAQQLGKFSPAVARQIGLVKKPDNEGNMIWQYGKTSDYLASNAAMGPLRLLHEYGKDKNARGMGPTARYVRFGTGVRADTADPEGARIGALYQMLKPIEKRIGVLRGSQQQGNGEFLSLLQARYRIGLEISQLDYKRKKDAIKKGKPVRILNPAQISGVNQTGGSGRIPSADAPYR